MNGESTARTHDDGNLSAHQDQTRRLVGAMMKLTGRSATGLARAAGLTPSTVNRFMHHSVRHTLSQRTMLALMTETFLAIKGRPRQSLDAGALAELRPAIAVYERGILELAPDVESALAEAKAATGKYAQEPAGRGGASDLPVLMASTQGINIQAGEFASAPLKTQRPPFMENDPNAFALLMADNSMAPRFDAGDMLYASPARSLQGINVDVVLERIAGGFTVGSLVSLTADTVRIATLSPRVRETHDRAKLRGIYRIVGVQRLGG